MNTAIGKRMNLSVNYGERVASTLEEVILAAGAENVSAFIAEPIVGATFVKNLDYPQLFGALPWKTV